MSQQHNLLSPSYENRITLAIKALDKDASLSVKRAASLYNVPRTSLRDRLAGCISKSDWKPVNRNLTTSEESAILQHILDLDSRGFPPTKDALRDMANKLLKERGSNPVGKNWPDAFLKRTPELKKRWSRPYDRQRALNEDPDTIRAWFELVRNTKAKYGIQDEDTFNFDETGFMMGVITSQLVITGSERRGKRKVIQPGNREWITVIQGICAAGWAIPPFTIYAGKHHISSWFEDMSIPACHQRSIVASLGIPSLY